MLDKKSRRVVIINNIQSDTIDQAIFILKNQKSVSYTSENDIVHEAQSIIDQYIRQVGRLKAAHGQYKSGKKDRERTFTPSVIITAMATAAFMLTVFFIITYTM